jgi:hypothetical protein
MLLASPCWASPAWFTEPAKLTAHALTVACDGTGPSRGTAIQDALASCAEIATSRLQSKFDIKTITIESEKDAGVHQEIKSDTKYAGLKCKPVHEDVAETDLGYRAYEQCEYDLKEIKELVGTPPPKDAPGLMKSTSSGDPTSLTISSVPACESILVISGKSPRIERCHGSPTTILLNPSDGEIVVRAIGFQSKTLKLAHPRERSSHDSVMVVLERM